MPIKLWSGVFQDWPGALRRGPAASDPSFTLPWVAPAFPDAPNRILAQNSGSIDLRQSWHREFVWPNEMVENIHDQSDVKRG